MPTDKKAPAKSTGAAKKPVQQPSKTKPGTSLGKTQTGSKPQK